MLVALLSLQTPDDPSRVGNQVEHLGKFNQVDFDDEDSILRVGGLVVGSEDPIVVARKTISAADDHVSTSVDEVVAPDDDVVVFEQVLLDFLEQFGHSANFFVDVHKNWILVAIRRNFA